MNFSELVPYHQAAFSHTGDFLAILKGKNLFVSNFLQLFDIFFLLDLWFRPVSNKEEIQLWNRSHEIALVAGRQIHHVHQSEAGHRPP